MSRMRLHTLLPGESEEKVLPVTHEGEEFIYVLEGILTLEIDNVRARMSRMRLPDSIWTMPT